MAANLKSVESSTETEDAKLEAHRESVRKGAAARKAAVDKLVEAHKEEFDGYLQAEKEARGIRSWDARRKERAEREFLKLLADNPHLSDLVIAQMASKAS